MPSHRGALAGPASRASVHHLPIHFDHTIVPARDKHATAHFFTEVFGLPAPVAWGPFLNATLSDGTTLQFVEPGGSVAPQHYAFLVGDDEFDALLSQLQARGVPLWADPRMSTAGINHNHGGRGVYFIDPSGHGLEAITRRYGSQPTP